MGHFGGVVSWVKEWNGTSSLHGQWSYIVLFKLHGNWVEYTIIYITKKGEIGKTLLLFCTMWRTPTETHMCKRDSNASGQVTNRQHLTREVRILENKNRKRPKLTNRPLCHLAISNGQFSSDFSLFATNLHNHFTDPRITWRTLVFYDTLWVSSRSLAVWLVIVEISFDQHCFPYSHTQMNRYNTGLNSWFSLTRWLWPSDFSWFMEWSILSLLGQEGLQ